jgi:DNA modification methylase
MPSLLSIRKRLFMNKIFVHSSEEMPELHDNSVALTVTSPPYWNAIDYDVHANDKSQHYRTRAYSNGFSEYNDYLNWLKTIFSEVFRVTKPGGFCAVVIGTVLHEGKHYPVPFDVTNIMTRIGWEFHQDILWHKCTGGVKRAGVTIQKPYPGYYYPNIMTEYILVFRKTGNAIYKDATQKEKEAAAYPISRLFTMDIANNIWHIAPIPPNYLDHPCPFPEEIPYRLITVYSYPDDLVLDPFLGSGQTVKVAKIIGRKYVGYEIIQKYVDLAEKRLNEPLSLREYQLVAIFDKVHLDEPSGSKNPNGKKPSRNQKNKKAEKINTPTLF